MPSFSDPEVLVTLAIAIAGLAIATLMVMIERKPRNSLMPNLFPTTPVLLMAGLISMIALVHLLNLYGIHTGTNR